MRAFLGLSGESAFVIMPRNRYRLDITMLLYHRILAAIVICLIALGMSSCVRTSEGVFNQASVYDAIVTTENMPLDAELEESYTTKVPVYKVGGKYYVLAEPAELELRTGQLIIYPDQVDSSRLVYAGATGSKAYYEVELHNYGSISCCVFAEDLSNPLAALPLDCKKPVGYYGMKPYRFVLTSRDAACLYDGKKRAVARVKDDEKLTWRALYAYPGAALLYVCVDLPGSIIMTPCYLLYEACK